MSTQAQVLAHIKDGLDNAIKARIDGANGGEGEPLTGAEISAFIRWVQHREGEFMGGSDDLADVLRGMKNKSLPPVDACDDGDGP